MRRHAKRSSGASHLRWLVSAALALAACSAGERTAGSDAATDQTTTADLIGDVTINDWTTDDRTTSADSQPELNLESTWNWQLQGDVGSSIDVDVYDIDLFDSSAELIASLQADGRIVICYFSAGSFEGWRPDANDFAVEDLGRTLDGFEDERWLDIRSDTVRAINLQRLDRAVTSRCDGVEPDNVTAYANISGFDLTPDDQLDFNRFLAREAHTRGLLIGLKNDLDQIPALVESFDFAVNEQCHEFDECDLNQPFLDVGKPVFNAEYAEEFVVDPGPICQRSLALDVRTLILPLDLDGSFRISCDEK